MSDPNIVGGCLCGAVRYTATADPAAVALCHCKDCQRQSGAPFSLNVLIEDASLVIEGDVKVYGTTGTGTGQPRERKFCGDCGSPILTTLAEMPGMAAIKAGTLDDPSWLEPELELWVDRRQPWVLGSEDRGEFATDLPT
ncbi:hypothetical protein GKE82_16945 [Conexibacter sp. W3-3-2]|uniref:GFA family protein n=1 Tax=Conexibacter sp. W3-3-2 TaxID=2675227 RepID=UPI0012B7932E|nr:GFA family protein [Conexibacter sp. W3-3-2]MTD45927.1 hypothetical protein [Conexibacter sp. W3-3-2]